MTMFDLLNNDSVRVMRAGKAGLKGNVEYKEVLDPAGGPLPVPCYIKRKRRRVYGKDRVEAYVDATLMYRVDEDLPEIRAEDFVITESGEEFKVTDVDQDRQIGTDLECRQLGLVATRLPVPGAKQDA